MELSMSRKNMVSYDLLLFMLKIETLTRGKKTPCHSSFSRRINCGPHRGSFAVQDHLRSNFGIISGLGITCGWGSFAALYTTDLYSTANDPQTGNDPQIGPQMIPNCKWTLMWTSNDPTSKGGMAWSWFPGFFLFVYFYIYCHELNDELDKHKEKIFSRRTL